MTYRTKLRIGQHQPS